MQAPHSKRNQTERLTGKNLKCKEAYLACQGLRNKGHELRQIRRFSREEQLFVGRKNVGAKPVRASDLTDSSQPLSSPEQRVKSPEPGIDWLWTLVS